MSRLNSMIAFMTGLMINLGLVSVAPAQTSVSAATANGISMKRVATNFTQPLFCGAPAADFARLFVVEQGGTIQILSLNDGTKTTFLDVSSLIASGGEQGLLGLAFHPQFTQNQKFYVNYTGVAAGETRVVEYQTMAASPDQADPNSARLILTFSQPEVNHNGGWLGFGPDGYLYIATGDGGNADDEGPGHTPATGNAQDITNNFLGKMLRVDVNRDEFPNDPNRNYGNPPTNPFVRKKGDDEIWAFGLRNPWRCSFDRLTGDLYIGDVGQDTREEIDYQPSSSTGGENYGWRLREGSIATPVPGIGGPRPPGAIEPAHEYGHGSGPRQGGAVVGGYVYRGPIASLHGAYFYSDFENSRIWSFRIKDGITSHFRDWTNALKPDVGAINNVSSFGEDAAGNLYLVDYDGDLFQIVQASPPPTLDSIVRGMLTKILTVVPTN